MSKSSSSRMSRASSCTPSVVQEELTGLIQDIVGAATHADWIAITTGLINDAREALIDDEPATACAR